MIIDSPGVGESDIMDQAVTQYLPQAFAFIYVINSANSGGIQKDRASIVYVNDNRLVAALKGAILQGNCCYRSILC